jgi:hypothetical protein
LAKSEIPVLIADFGISGLRTKLRSRDAEGALHNLALVVANIAKFLTALTAVGFTDTLTEKFTEAITGITADNELQYNLLTARKELVQNNLGVFNDLYAQLMEFCEVGKMLYKTTNPARVQEYTFSYLLTKVRHVHHSQSEPQQ